jgi:hypothetical protein
MLGVHAIQSHISSAASTVAASIALQAKSAKLDTEAEKIGQMKSEAQEKYDSAMSAATTEIVTGIALHVASVVSAVSSFSGSNGVLRGPLTHTLLGGFPFDGQFLTLHRRSDQAQEAVDEAQALIDSKDDSSAADVDAARGRRKAGLDNIEKLLDIIRSMNPPI